MSVTQTKHNTEIGVVLIKVNKKANKGKWWMPRFPEAKKDVISCEKLRLGANNL